MNTQHFKVINKNHDIAIINNIVYQYVCTQNQILLEEPHLEGELPESYKAFKKQVCLNFKTKTLSTLLPGRREMYVKKLSEEELETFKNSINTTSKVFVSRYKRTVNLLVEGIHYE